MARISQQLTISRQLAARLRQIEYHLEKLIEGSAARLFPTSQTQHDLALRLVDSMRQGIERNPAGELIAPNLFILHCHPERAEALVQDGTLLDGLTRILQEETNEAGLYFNGPLALRVAPAPAVPPDEIYVQALHSRADLTGTSALEATETSPAIANLVPAAYLIVDGIHVFPLRQPVVNIGRRADNHLVVDDASVSRVHAQLRIVRGQFVIFDLDSAGGTWVNGERIRQCALQPGDVISLSGIPLVFGQDAPLTEETQEMRLDEPGG